MIITRRSGAIAFFITLGVLLVGAAITLNIGWIVLNKLRVVYLVLGVILFALLVAGVTLNTVFLVREIRRNERQDSFLNAVTHELKTPIASIRLYLETLQRRPLEEVQRQQFYGIMLSDTERLLAMVDQVLKAGEVTHSQAPRQRVRVDVREMVSSCVELTLQRHHLGTEAILMEAPGLLPPVFVDASPEDLRTALQNVLENAVKYSPHGVHIRARISLPDADSVAISVTDRGLGIPQNQLKRVFKRFYRVPGRDAAKIKGTGLGLFLVRAIVRQHGGEVKAESAGVNQGSTIRMTLPVAAGVERVRRP